MLGACRARLQRCSRRAKAGRNPAYHWVKQQPLQARKRAVVLCCMVSAQSCLLESELKRSGRAGIEMLEIFGSR